MVEAAPWGAGLGPQLAGLNTRPSPWAPACRVCGESFHAECLLFGERWRRQEVVAGCRFQKRAGVCACLHGLLKCIIRFVAVQSPPHHTLGVQTSEPVHSAPGQVGVGPVCCVVGCWSAQHVLAWRPLWMGGCGCAFYLPPRLTSAALGCFMRHGV
jgi:hypothetical protein